MPIHETAEDRRNQIEIAETVLRRYPTVFDGYRLFPPEDILDGVFFKDNKDKLFFEAKQRYVGFGHYPDYFIGFIKVHAAVNKLAETGLRTVALIRFIDGYTASFDLLRDPHTCRIEGRTGERPEVVAAYRWDDMTIIDAPDPRYVNLASHLVRHVHAAHA